MNHFGLKVTGIWLLAVQLSGIMMFFDIGITNSLVRLLAMRKFQEDSTYAHSIFTTTFYILLLIGVLIIFSSLWLSSVYVDLFDIPQELLKESKDVILLAIISVGIILPMRTGYGMLASKHLFDKIQHIDTVGNACKLILILVLFGYGTPSLLSLGYVVFGTSVAISVTLFLIAIQYSNSGRQILYWKNVSRSVLLLLLSMSFAALLVTFSALLLHQGTSSIVGFLIDLQSVSLLAVPLMIFMSITPFFQTFATITSPIAAGVSTDSERDKLFNNYIQTTRYLVCISYLAVISFFYIGELIFGLWLLGPKTTLEDIRVINTIVTLLFAGYTLGLSSSIGRSILASVGRHWSSSVAELWTTFVGVLVGILLVYLTDLKVIGMALGIVLAMSAKGLYVYPRLLSNYFACSAYYIIFKTTVVPSLVCLPYIIMGLVIQTFFIPIDTFPTSTSELLLIWLASVWLCVISIWLSIMPTEHRNKVVNVISKYVHKHY